MAKTINPGNLLRVKGLRKEYDTSRGPVTVLEENDFAIDQGSFTIIYGPSGSGKSTLVHILAGLEPPSQGTVEVLGQNLYELNADLRASFRASYVSLVYQTNYWVKSLSVVENVALPLLLGGQNRSTALRTAADVIESIGLSELSNLNPTVLSGGEQQRVSMARALVVHPKILFADEPTGNLDSKNGQAVIDLLLRAQRDYGCSIILVTHNMEYLPLSNQQLYIRDGTVEAHQGPFQLPESLLNSIRSQLADVQASGPKESNDGSA